MLLSANMEYFMESITDNAIDIAITRIHVENFIKKNLIDQSQLESYLERLKYINTTKPVDAFRQIGIKRTELTRICYRLNKSYSLKEAVNFLDFDAWNHVSKPIPLKSKYEFGYEGMNVFHSYHIYFAKWMKHLNGYTEITDIRGNIHNIDNHAMAQLCLSYITHRFIDYNKSPYENILQLFDEEIFSEMLEKRNLLQEYNENPHKIRHVFTNIHVLTDSHQLMRIGKMMRNCLIHQHHNHRISRHHFAMIKTEDSRVPYYVAEYAIRDHRAIIARRGHKMNMKFPDGFDFTDSELFRDYLQSTIKVV